MDTTLVKTSLGSVFGDAGIGDGYLIVQNGSVDMVYLTDRSAAGRFELLKRMRAAAIAHGDVDEALYREPNPADGGERHTLTAVHPAWRIAGERTGDLFVTHKTGGSFNDPVNPLVGNHGSPFTTDNTFAIVAGGGQVVQRTVRDEAGPRFDDAVQNPGQAQNIDVAPTVMALLGLDGPANSEGRVLREAFTQGVLPAGSGPGDGPPRSCAVAARFRRVGVRPRGRRLRFAVRPRSGRRARVVVAQQSLGRRVVRARGVARFGARRPSTRRLARARDGVLGVTVRSGADVRRYAVLRRGGRYVARWRIASRSSCGALRALRLGRGAFGGPGGAALPVVFRLGESARVRVELRRGGRVVRRVRAGVRSSGMRHRVRVRPRGLRRGVYRVRVVVDGRVHRTVSARRL
jgi:hypothetical protein